MTPRLDQSLYPSYLCLCSCSCCVFYANHPCLWIGLRVVRVVYRRQGVIVFCLDPSMTEAE